MLAWPFLESLRKESLGIARVVDPVEAYAVRQMRAFVSWCSAEQGGGLALAAMMQTRRKMVEFEVAVEPLARRS